MPTIDHLPRPWLLAAITGMPVSVLVGAERTGAEGDTPNIARPMQQGARGDERSHPTSRPSTH